MKEPKLVSLSHMRSIFEPHLPQLGNGLFINDELAILYGNADVFHLMMQQQPPFVINDFRMGIVSSGYIDASVNLVEKHITAGNIVFLGPGTIVSPLRISDDLEIFGFVLSNSFPMPFPAGQLPAAFNGQVRDFQMAVGEADMATVRHILDTLWNVVHQPCCNRLLVGSLVQAVMYHYDGLFRSYTDQLQAAQSREQTIFDRFIYLVNAHASQEHHIAFYARKMCLTVRYLGTVVRKASGVTAKEWIDRALLTRIQVELRHTDKSVTQISEEMNFPNVSFFVKYFKRLAGVTPMAFKKD